MQNPFKRTLIQAFASLLLIFLLFLPSTLSAQEKFSSPRNNIKATLLSLGSGSTRISYERALDSAISAEFTVGIIGMGWDILNHSDPRGFIVKLAPKWNLYPVGTPNALSGFYFKPELIYADYTYFCKDNSISEPQHTRQLALLAEGGFQIVAKWFVFDIYTGLGPTVGSGNYNNYYHGFMRFPANGFMAYTAGFRLGVAF